MRSFYTKTLRLQSTAVMLFAGVTAGACSGGAAPRTEPSPEPATASEREIEALYRARLDSARMRFTEADVRFMTGMIGHHAQALVMAGLAPTHGASPAVLTLTSRIINAQKDEIATMQGWLRERDLPVPEVRADGTMPMMHGENGHVLMPGMLSPEQMQQLRDARGTEFDRAFLTLMIQHHEGAVSMVHALFAEDGAAQGDLVFKLSSDIQVDQITEIARMELMLEGLPAGGARF